MTLCAGNCCLPEDGLHDVHLAGGNDVHRLWDKDIAQICGGASSRVWWGCGCGRTGTHCCVAQGGGKPWQQHSTTSSKHVTRVVDRRAICKLQSSSKQQLGTYRAINP